MHSVYLPTTCCHRFSQSSLSPSHPPPSHTPPFFQHASSSPRASQDGHCPMRPMRRTRKWTRHRTSNAAATPRSAPASLHSGTASWRVTRQMQCDTEDGRPQVGAREGMQRPAGTAPLLGMMLVCHAPCRRSSSTALGTSKAVHVLYVCFWAWEVMYVFEVGLFSKQ